MNREIERKFLVVDDSWKSSVHRTVRQSDGLILKGERGKLRVRKESGKAFLTLKGPRCGISRAEFEYEIPVEEAEVLLRDHCGDQLVEKTRHFVTHDGNLWHIDMYDGMLAGVVFAEIELQHESQAFARPAWAGEEVTGRDEYAKSTLLARALRAGASGTA